MSLKFHRACIRHTEKGISGYIEHAVFIKNAFIGTCGFRLVHIAAQIFPFIGIGMNVSYRSMGFPAERYPFMILEIGSQNGCTGHNFSQHGRSLIRHIMSFRGFQCRIRNVCQCQTDTIQI